MSLVLRHGLAVLLVLGMCARGAAQSGPGLPNLVYPPNELFRIVATIGSGNHGHSTMHDGWLAVFKSDVGVDFFDIANPYRPVLVQSITAGMDPSEPHTFAQTTAWGGKHVVMARGPGGLGGTGFAIWDWSDIFAPRRVVQFTLPGVPGGYASGVFWIAVQAPYIYVPTGSLGLHIVDARNPASPVVVNKVPKTATGGFNAVLAFVVGNMLILADSDNGTGFARLDISDPVNPVLLHSTTNVEIPYGAQVNGGKLLVAAVSGCVSCPGGNNGSLHVHDIGPTSFPQVNTAPLPSRGGSVVMQDEIAHVAASAAYVKIDTSTYPSYTVLGTTPDPFPGGDFDWVTPMGNLVILGDDQGFGTQIVPHQSLPDDTGPTVTMVVPQNGATDQALTTRVGITMSDMIALESIDRDSFMVRPVGGTPLLGSYSNQFGIVNFAPEQPLQPGTTYEVVVPAGGMRDFAGNAVPATFISRFSTGGQVTAITVEAQATAATLPGQTVTFDVESVSGPGPYQFSWTFGDGTPPTPPSSASQVTHTFADAGHYSVLVRVGNGVITGSDSFLHTVHHPLTALRPTHSSTIAIDDARRRVYCVNADNDSVTAIDSQALQRVFEAPAGAHPRTLAQAPDGTLWVVCQDDATIRVLDPDDGATLGSIALPYASAPYGIAMSPDGTAAWVTLRALGAVAKLDPAARVVVATAPAGPEPRGIAIAADSERIFVSRFVSRSRATRPVEPPAVGAAPIGAVYGTSEPLQPVEPSHELFPAQYAEVYELSAAKLARVRTIPLAMDPGPDTGDSGRGLPNYLGAPAISPDGLRMWVPSKKDDVERGLFRDGQPLTFQNTVRTIVSEVDLVASQEDLAARIDFNNRDMAVATACSPLGDYAFHALQGSNAVDVRDAYSGALVAVIEGTGLAPQGLVLSGDGRRLFVHNFMSRSVTVYDAAGVTTSRGFALPRLASVPAVASERLAPDVLRGKQIFYNAADPRMNQDGYLSCASCHLDGEHDGRTWDFTDRGEGLRNTISLAGRGGTAHGNVHWTANFDEIQDFENDMRSAFGGDGFMDDALFHSGTVSNPLGQPKAGLSEDLDALAAYVSSLTSVGKSPYRNQGGTLTGAAQSGRILFQQLGCAQCHSGPAFTDSASGQLHDVGTIKPSSGKAQGGPLTGLDTPTLRGLWSTAPYLHDGSAASLLEVLTTKNPSGQHGATAALTPAQRNALVAYLLQIDDLEPGAP
jgi:DNA-binding beta-propeller fold protein YncE